MAEGLDPQDLELVEACGAYARDAMHVTRTPGLSLAVARKGRLIWQEGFGMADLSARLPTTVGTTFRVGSLSKTYVAIAVMQLVDRGVLELHAPIRRFLPSFDIVNPLGEREVTVYDLLTYRSGMALDTADQASEVGAFEPYLKAALASGTRPEYNQDAPLWTAKVGAKYQYSSLGMALAGFLVERTNPDGLSFADYVAAYITGPLQLRSSGFPRSDTGRAPEDLVGRLCTGYARFGPALVPTPDLHPRAVPAVSLITTPGDHALLLLGFMSAGSANGTCIVQPETARLMLTPQVEMAEAIDESGWWNGIGFEMTRVGEPGFSFGHGGAQPWGWYSWSAAFPNYDAIIVAFCNRWDLPRWYNPMLEMAPGLVMEFVRRWLNEEPAATGRHARDKSWSWRASWTMGFMMVERTLGLLGAEGAIDDDKCERIALQTRGFDAEFPDLWDADGFSAGAHAMLAIPPTPESIRRFLESGEAPVSTVDFPLLALSFGHRGELQLPQAFFASRGWDGPTGPNTSPAALGAALRRGRP